MLRSFLPGRYEVGPVFALDAQGGRSQQVDLAVYDRQYSPLWFEAGGHRYVPVESIYAVFEVKQTMNKPHLDYAADKVRSVRELHRTSGKIVDIYGVQEGPDPKDRPILAGIVTLRCDWKGGLTSVVAKRNITTHRGSEHIDLGLALTDLAFDHVPADCNEMLTPGLFYSEPATQLIFFVMHLFRRLQAIGTAPSVDLVVYENMLAAVNPEDYAEIDGEDR
jgi:hypothetical protein